MDAINVDPYEQQLLKVFHSHDKNCCGSLDRDGLTELCKTLQLEEQTTNLITTLIKDKQSRVTFIEFRDALLTLLGEMQNKYAKNDEPLLKQKDEFTSEGEISPKIVYGSKKYGRRSKPRNESVTINSDVNKSLNTSPMVQRSNSQSAVQCKKRKTNYKLKRCTSLPGSYDLRVNTFDNSFIASDVFSDETDLLCTEEMLREAWNKLGVGKDGYLNKTELILVCDAIGMHKLADGIIRQLPDKINFNHKISFQELLTCVQQDEAWFDVLNTPVGKDSELHRSNDNVFPDSQTFQFVTLGPNGNGIINSDILIEMWDNIGIHAPKELLCELGFSGRQINIAELAEELDKQLKGTIEQTNTDLYNNPSVALLQATLSLYQAEIKCFKNIFEQMQAEREKLKSDVAEANNRATLLAQEVDDNHSRMEQNTLNQVKLLEQRHSDILREMKLQYSQDKEQLSCMKESLQNRIGTLEQEIIKLKSDLLIAQEYSLNMEKENQNLSGRIKELCEDNSALNEQILVLDNEKQKYSELGREENRMLFNKLSTLQIENSQLKDKNDEMLSEIESLSNLVANMRTKSSSTPTPSMNTLDQSMEENISIICDGVGVGAKRRSDYSPSKDLNLFSMTGGSPRLEKIRKFSEGKNDLEVPFKSSEFKSSESGIDTDALYFDSSSNSLNFENENEIKRLKAKIVFLEQVLVQNNILVPTIEPQVSQPGSSSENSYLTDRINTLENIIHSIKNELKTASERQPINSDDFSRLLTRLNEVQLKDDDGTETSRLHAVVQTELNHSFDELVSKLERENKELNNKCAELESCIDLLRNEYEKCEDYWQNKVDEERQLFDLEQKIQNDKLSELIEKMKEYEEQYANQDVLDTRLFPIEENNLEKQFEDLEQEFEDYKSQSEDEIKRKDKQINVLKEELSKLSIRRDNMTDVGVQVEGDSEEMRILNKMKYFSSYVIENTSRFPEEMLPLSPQNIEDTSTSSKNETPDSTCTKQPNWSFMNNQSEGYSTSNRSESNTPCRPKRTRKHDVNIYKKNNQDVDKSRTVNTNTPDHQSQWKGYQNTKYTADQMISMPVISFQNLNLRRNYLEQRVRHLQMRIKHQHYRTEQILQHYWHHFSGERADLHARLKWLQSQLDHQVNLNNGHLDKLEKTDVLVKDLYIENSYLIAKVQRLEQQCHLLAQCNANNYSSV